MFYTNTKTHTTSTKESQKTRQDTGNTNIVEEEKVVKESENDGVDHDNNTRRCWENVTKEKRRYDTKSRNAKFKLPRFVFSYSWDLCIVWVDVYSSPSTSSTSWHNKQSTINDLKESLTIHVDYSTAAWTSFRWWFVKFGFEFWVYQIYIFHWNLSSYSD